MIKSIRLAIIAIFNGLTQTTTHLSNATVAFSRSAEVIALNSEDAVQQWDQSSRAERAKEYAKLLEVKPLPKTK